MDIAILRGRASEAPIGWKLPSNGFLLLGSSIADDVAHDTKNVSIARVPKGIKCDPQLVIKIQREINNERKPR